MKVPLILLTASGVLLALVSDGLIRFLALVSQGVL